MLQVGTQISVIVFALMVLLFAAPSSNSAETATIDKWICDLPADAALELGDYPTAIELHQKLIRSERNNPMVHYHLGFAYGMLGHTTEEIGEYRTAIELGFEKWDLFLNLGLAYADRQDLENAAAALETAVLLGPEHAQTHFNLAVVYERQNRLTEALQQIIAALVLAPQDLDAANTDAIICARMGDLVSARNIWTQLTRTAPNYFPARTNLAILNHSCGNACGSYVDSNRTTVRSQLMDQK